MACVRPLDITAAFWPFVESLASPPRACRDDEDDDPYDATFASDAYREMCAAVRSGCALEVRSPFPGGSSIAIVFEGIDALLRGGEATLASAFGHADELAVSFRRIESWVGANELAGAFGEGVRV